MEDQDCFIAVLATAQLPTGILFQKASGKMLIAEWTHLPNTPKKSISGKDELLAELVTKLRSRCILRMGVEPSAIYTPIPLPKWEQYLQHSQALQMALANYTGEIKYHLPADPRLALINTVPFKLNQTQASKPIPQAITVFTDGNKQKGACVYEEEGQWKRHITSPQKSAQRSELAAAILAFSLFKDRPLNLIVDSLYVYHTVSHIFDAYVSPTGEGDLLKQFVQLKTILEIRVHPFFVAHIRSHQPLPGMLSEGNARADEAAREAFHLSTPWESHSFFHQNAKSLQREFGLTRAEATAIIQQCPDCSRQGHSIPMGVNPRGLKRNEIWQMDVTQYSPFAPWKYIHVIIDTFSGFITASLQRGEAFKHVQNHCFRTFAVLGTPKELKTDNGPAYCSSNFAKLCQTWGIVHKFGIPYNSTGQALVERANQTLKQTLENQKGGKREGGPTLPAYQNQLAKALYTLNFKNLIGTHPERSRAEQHFGHSVVSTPNPLVLYRQLPDPSWRGPAELITWGRGYAAVKPIDEPILWTPGRCVKPYHPPNKPAIPDPKTDQEPLLGSLFS